MEKPCSVDSEDFIKNIEKLKEETGVEMEIISGVPVFTIESGVNDKLISRIATLYGEKAIFRVINAYFIEDALQYGTDKEHVDKHDFRQSADGSGYDIEKIEETAVQDGLKRADVFYGWTSDLFIERSHDYDSIGTGIVKDRSAILIFNGEKLRENRSGGYTFLDRTKKREALVGIIKFRVSFTELEKALHALASVDEKISFLEEKIFQDFNDRTDFEQAPYLSLNIIELLFQESVENAIKPSPLSVERIERLKKIADRLEYEVRMTGIIDNLEELLTDFRDASKKNTQLSRYIRGIPNFIIQSANDHLRDSEVNEKYRKRFLEIIEVAQQFEQELKNRNSNMAEGIESFEETNQNPL